jgi:serine protease
MSRALVRSELRRPIRKQDLDEIRGVTGVETVESHALSDGAHVLVIPGKRDRRAIDDAISRISTLANVEYVEEDKVFTPQFVPNDSHFAAADPGLWGLYPVNAVVQPSPGGTGSYGADFQTAWDTATGSGVVVAIVDGGITPHRDIVGPNGTVSPATGNLISPGYDFISDCRTRGSNVLLGGCPASTPDNASTVAPFPDATDTGDFVSAQDSLDNPALFPSSLISDSTWHGTHITGIIAAIGNNSTGTIGGAYNVKILPVRVLGKGISNSSDVMEGVRWAAGVHPTIPNPHPARVINLSLGGPGTCSHTEQAAIDDAITAGAVVVVAAGNESADISNFVPANCSNVIAVAATARDGSRATYSNFSSPATNVTNPAFVTLAAPGGDQANYPASFDPGVLSTVNASATTPDLSPSGSTYAYFDGTSMASAHVTAAVALMFSRNPNLTPAEIRNILRTPSSLTAFPSFGSGSGYVDWDCAVRKNCGAGLLNAKLAVQNAIPLLTPSRTDVNFGNHAIGSVAHETVTFSNLTVNTLAVGTATISGPDASLFSVVVDDCQVQANVATQSTCQITMSFRPRASGNFLATLSLPIDSTGITAVGLTGSSSLNASGGSGGGCAVLPYSEHPDLSLLVTLLLVVLYRARQSLIRSRVQT